MPNFTNLPASRRHDLLIAGMLALLSALALGAGMQLMVQGETGGQAVAGVSDAPLPPLVKIEAEKYTSGLGNIQVDNYAKFTAIEVPSDAYVGYQFQLAKPGDYELYFRGSAPLAATTMRVFINGSFVVQGTIPAGPAGAFSSIRVDKIHFNEGRNTLRVEVSKGTAALDYFTLL